MAPDGSTAGAVARPTHVDPVPLSDVASRLGAAADLPSVDVTGLTASSSLVQRGDLYAGLPGARTHGARFAEVARDAGAVAILTDADGAELAASSGLPTVVVGEPRRILGSVAAQVYGRPADAFTLIGVTGTQGKTTVTHLIAAGAAAAGRITAVIGTNGASIAGEPLSSVLTTPEAPELHALFAVMRERGVDVCAIEVSSHALVMGRVDGVVFDLGVFTNLGRDHLDFHRDMDDYFEAKAQLFAPDRSRRALVSIDDAWGLRLAIDARLETQTYSADDAVADWVGVLDVAESTPHQTVFSLRGPRGLGLRAAVAMAGAFNVANAVAAIAACAAVGVDPEDAARGIAAVGSVRGRMEVVSGDRPFSVVVDYAHKPDAVVAALDALRSVTRGRLLIVIGAGGDRDRGKRPLMGKASAERADVVVVTDDNPRSEDPAEIRSEILAGARGAATAADIREVGDRADAIEAALREAAPGDTVLIAGKGHEAGQEIGDRVLPFDDRATALAVLMRLDEERPAP
ncbi:MAG TPA: UDP-N-acetylmuramoyl-L-alanyl-D-glutamate--2,6-diaminopimelate ligase [Nocardioidaceae bacterium]|nr:UDP-N-acetylmuramoyl-L-alanyl-D-glutamate--2,6-diaminopimelate ligase [Nocardioidaceae bacterium]